MVGSVQTSLSTYAAHIVDDGAAPVCSAGRVMRRGGEGAVDHARRITVVGAGSWVATGQAVGFKWTAAGGVVAFRSRPPAVFTRFKVRQR